MQADGIQSDFGMIEGRPHAIPAPRQGAIVFQVVHVGLVFALMPTRPAASQKGGRFAFNEVKVARGLRITDVHIARVGPQG